MRLEEIGEGALAAFFGREVGDAAPEDITDVVTFGKLG
jgi:hypothetical protein